MILRALHPSLPEACQLAHWAYKPNRETIPLQAPTSWVISIRQDPTTHADVVMIARDRFAWLVFPGTVTLRDWVMNANLKGDMDLEPVAMGRSETPFLYHRGFVANASYLMPHIRRFLRGNKAQQVYLVGHSAGGATALHVSRYLFDNNIIEGKDLSVITLGQPAVGNQAAADYLESIIAADPERYIRIVNAGDPVPTALHLLGYRQPPGCLYIARDGSVHQSPGKSFFKKDHRPARIRGLLNLLRGKIFPAHSTKAYLQKLGLEEI